MKEDIDVVAQVSEHTLILPVARRAKVVQQQLVILQLWLL